MSFLHMLERVQGFVSIVVNWDNVLWCTTSMCHSSQDKESPCSKGNNVCYHRDCPLSANSVTKVHDEVVQTANTTDMTVQDFKTTPGILHALKY